MVQFVSRMRRRGSIVDWSSSEVTLFANTLERGPRIAEFVDHCDAITERNQNTQIGC